MPASEVYLSPQEKEMGVVSSKSISGSDTLQAILVSVNNAAMNTGVPISLWDPDFTFSGHPVDPWTSRIWTARVHLYANVFVQW